MTTSKSYSYILIVCGLIGLVASFLLIIDTMKLAEDPGLDLPCNLSPFISCTSVIGSSQGKVFGFPNPLLGIAGFGVIVTAGVIMVLGGNISRKFWQVFILGLSLSILFFHWLIFQSIYVLGNLCLYCMITWAVIWPIFIYSIKNYFTADSFFNRNYLAILIGWYLLIILLILIRFREYFIS